MRLRSNKTLKNNNKFKHRNNNTKLNKQSKRDWNDNETVSHGNFVKFGFILHDSWTSENHFEIQINLFYVYITFWSINDRAFEIKWNVNLNNYYISLRCSYEFKQNSSFGKGDQENSKYYVEWMQKDLEKTNKFKAFVIRTYFQKTK